VGRTGAVLMQGRLLITGHPWKTPSSTALD